MQGKGRVQKDPTCTTVDQIEHFNTSGHPRLRHLRVFYKETATGLLSDTTQLLGHCI